MKIIKGEDLSIICLHLLTTTSQSNCLQTSHSFQNKYLILVSPPLHSYFSIDLSAHEPSLRRRVFRERERSRNNLVLLITFARRPASAPACHFAFPRAHLPSGCFLPFRFVSFFLLDSSIASYLYAGVTC